VDELFPILLAIVFIVGPLLEALKRKGKPPQQPPQRRTPPPQRVPQQRLPQPPSRMEEVTTKPRSEESAATMVPGDLWEILTGQKELPVPTTPQPMPERKRPSWDVVYDPEADDDEETEFDEAAVRDDVDVETRRMRVEGQSLERLERHPEPIIISLEENLPTAAQRHAAFHQKITAVAPVVAAAPSPGRVLLPLGNLPELRRAFLLQEILGKPKGLE
jgi:hypothetical protein